MTKHTQGPWQVAQDGSLGSIETVNGNKPIGQSLQTKQTRRPEDHEERKANARLMAAAPELLEALKALVEEATAVWEYPEDYPQIEAASEAIAKAEGANT